MHLHLWPQTKVEAFGAFVEIGAESQGLVHISQLSVSPRGHSHCLASWPGRLGMFRDVEWM